MDDLMNHYLTPEEKEACELIECSFWAMLICLGLGAAWALVNALS